MTEAFVMAQSHRYSKRTESTSSKTSNGEQGNKDEENPNMIVYRKVGQRFMIFQTKNMVFFLIITPFE